MEETPGIKRQDEIPDDITRAVRDYFDALASGLCHVCRQPVEQEEQIGRCVYARPCGHRMFQGKARKKESAAMELSQEEINKACQIAVLEVEKRTEQFKPDKPVIKDKRGWICEKIYLGTAGDELAFSLCLQWNYTVAGSVGRITQIVHVRLLCLNGEQGRVLRLKSLHKPEWNTERKCLQCIGFNERQVIEADTSLHEY